MEDELIEDLWKFWKEYQEYIGYSKGVVKCDIISNISRHLYSRELVILIREVRNGCHKSEKFLKMGKDLIEK